MYLLYCDESNLQHIAGDFLLYGGVIVPAANAASLSRTIDKLRVQAGIAPEAELKFNPVLDPLDHGSFRAFKQSVIEAAIAHECKILAYVVLHDLAGNTNQARRYGINTVCFHFHCVLARHESHGIVLIDRFTDENNKVDAHLREKMWKGVERPHLNTPTRLTNIVGFHYSAIGQSHFTSLIDILIGSVRFALNAHTRGDANKRKGALNLMKMLSPMFFREAGSNRVPDIGFTFSPMNVKVAKYRDQYISLQEFLREGGLDSSQQL